MLGNIFENYFALFLWQEFRKASDIFTSNPVQGPAFLGYVEITNLWKKYLEDKATYEAINLICCSTHLAPQTRQFTAF